MSGVIEVRHKPQGAVLDAYGKCRSAVHIIRGPLGGGKTYESIDKIIKLCCEQKPTKADGIRKSRGVVVRNTYPDLISTIIKDVREVIPEEMGHMTMGHPPELDMDFDLEDSTRVVANVMFLALDKEDDVRKIRGLNATWVYINEVKEVAKANFDMVTARADRYPQIGWSQFGGVFCDTNAWDQDHWLEELAQQAMKGELPGYEFFVQPGAVMKVNGKWVVNPNAENPAAVKLGYYEKILRGKREDWIRVNLANEIGYSFDGKPVHPDYSDTVNVSPEPLIPFAGMVVVGLDFGLTPAAVFWQRQQNGQWWGIDELVEVDMANDAFAMKLKAHCAQWKLRVPGVNFKFVGDPSGDNRSMTDGRTTFQMYRLAGIPAIPASTNDPQVRRDALIRPLTRTVKGEPGLLLSPHLKWLRKSLSGAWCYARVKVAGKDHYKDEAVKNAFSHVGEAGEYGLMDAGENFMAAGGSSVEWPKNGAPVEPKLIWTPFS